MKIKTTKKGKIIIEVENDPVVLDSLHLASTYLYFASVMDKHELARQWIKSINLLMANANTLINLIEAHEK